MMNLASKLILILLAVTFIQSAYDKSMDWKGNVGWLKGHFANTPIRNMVPLSLGIILILELATSVCCLSGLMELMITGGRTFGLYGGVLSCITLIFLLIGQRMAKDYDGARTIVIYFLPAVMLVYWLN